MANKQVLFEDESYELSYEILNPNGEFCALFLHGWGANKELMKQAFGKELANFKHVYLDMPGFGASEIYRPLTTADYASIVSAFVLTLPKKPDIIIAHSFGGKVATLLNSPNLALLSSAGIVIKKRPLVRIKIAVFKALKGLGLGKFYRFFASKDVSGMSQTMYETLKNVVDEDFSSHFSGYNGRALIFWGDKDSATPLRSGEKIHELIKNSRFFPLEGDHFFFLRHAKFIAQKIQSELGASKISEQNLG